LSAGADDQLTNAAACRRFGGSINLVRPKNFPSIAGNGLVHTAFALYAIARGRYRQRAEDAKHRAAQAKDPSIKSAFEHVAAGWVALAEQVERIDTEKFPLREEENNHSVR